MVQPTLAHRASELGKLVTAANKKKAEALFTAQALRGSENRFKLVSPAEISRIANDESVFKPPFTAQRIVQRRYGLDFLVIAPVRYDADTFRRDAALAEIPAMRSPTTTLTSAASNEASRSWRRPRPTGPLKNGTPSATATSG